MIIKGRYVMKFILVVIVIRLIISAFMINRKNKNVEVENGIKMDVKHPAEFELRW